MSSARLWIPLLVLGLAAGAAAEPVSWLHPRVEYVADTLMQSEAGALTGRVWASGAKERRELQTGGQRHVVILRKDRGVAWVLMPEQRMYLETPLGEGDLVADRFAGGRLERNALGVEAVNGVRATRYHVHGRATDGTAFDGSMWMTEQEIPVRVVTGEGRERILLELRNLSIGAVDPARFEIPAGYRRFELPAPARADVDALRERFGR